MQMAKRIDGDSFSDAEKLHLGFIDAHAPLAEESPLCGQPHDCVCVVIILDGC